MALVCHIASKTIFDFHFGRINANIYKDFSDLVSQLNARKILDPSKCNIVFQCLFLNIVATGNEIVSNRLITIEHFLGSTSQMI